MNSCYASPIPSSEVAATAIQALQSNICGGAEDMPPEQVRRIMTMEI